MIGGQGVPESRESKQLETGNKAYAEIPTRVSKPGGDRKAASHLARATGDEWLVAKNRLVRGSACSKRPRAR